MKSVWKLVTETKSVQFEMRGTGVRLLAARSGKPVVTV